MLDAMVKVADVIPPPIDPLMPDMPESAVHSMPPADYAAMPEGMDLVESSLGVIS